jgi:hypothetical protein
MSAFFEPLNRLVERYRMQPFVFWQALSDRREQIHDFSEGGSNAVEGWQADTTVLEIETTAQGERYAHVAIFLNPMGIEATPPAPAVSFLAFQNGRVTGTWADGTEYEIQAPVGTMPPNTSLERTRGR